MHNSKHDLSKNSRNRSRENFRAQKRRKFSSKNKENDPKIANLGFSDPVLQMKLENYGVFICKNPIIFIFTNENQNYGVFPNEMKIMGFYKWNLKIMGFLQTKTDFSLLEYSTEENLSHFNTPKKFDFQREFPKKSKFYSKFKIIMGFFDNHCK